MNKVWLVWGKTHICDGLVDWELLAVCNSEKTAKEWVKYHKEKWDAHDNDFRIGFANVIQGATDVIIKS